MKPDEEPLNLDVKEGLGNVENDYEQEKSYGMSNDHEELYENAQDVNRPEDDSTEVWDKLKTKIESIKSEEQNNDLEKPVFKLISNNDTGGKSQRKE